MHPIKKSWKPPEKKKCGREKNLENCPRRKNVPEKKTSKILPEKKIKNCARESAKSARENIKKTQKEKAKSN